MSSETVRSKPTTPRVTAVVLNWCDAEAASRCVRALRATRCPGLSVLLVDNGSPDGSGEVLRERFPDVEFIQTGRNLGYTGGNNRGIERALEDGADYVLILNHDTWVEPGAVRRLVETAQADPTIGAVAPTVVDMADPDHVWYDGGEFDPKRALGVHWNGNGRAPRANGTRDVSFFSGCAVLLSAEALREVGAFEESFFLYVEDVDLALRLLRDGWRVIHEPHARVLHRVPPEGTEPSPEQIRYRDRNRRRVARRHLTPLRRAVFHGWFYPTRMVHLVRYLARRDFERARAIVRGISER